MIRRKPLRSLLLLTACGLLIGQAGLAVAAGSVARPLADAPVALTSLTALEISWQPTVDYASVLLTVSGTDGAIVRREFVAGEAIRLGLLDPDVADLGDGQYGFELTFSPDLDPETRAVLDTARLVGDEATVDELRKSGAIPASPMVHSGSFRIKNGSVVVDAQEVLAKDILHLDDVIIDGSLCVGFDCVNGESFGFDTLRLKENNVRLHFDDTSNSASFPKNDWRIVANDTSNGGASYLAIEDSTAGRQVFRVEAGARSNALYVKSSGKIGIGTSTPAVDVDVKTGNTPTLRLQQDGTSGFTAQTWDVAGNEAGFFVRDATNGSTLPFRIRPGAPSSAIDIAATGRVGVGAASPDATLEVAAKSSNIGAGNAVLKLVNPNGGAAIQIDADDDGSSFWNISTLSGDNTFRINRNGGGTDLELDSTTGNLTIVGSIFTGGGTCGGGCDTVFQEDYPLASIEEHAQLMWRNGYLPTVGPTPENQPINLSEMTGRLLNELEKAHIYIEQLNRRLEKLEAMVSQQ